MKKTTPLNKLIHQLIKIEPDSSPLISCFVNIVISYKQSSKN